MSPRHGKPSHAQRAPLISLRLVIQSGQSNSCLRTSVPERPIVAHDPVALACGSECCCGDAAEHEWQTEHACNHSFSP